MIPVASPGHSKEDNKRAVHASFDRLLIALSKDGSMQVRVVTYIPDISYLEKHNYDASGNQITKIMPDYDGLIIVQEWGGKFVTGYQYKNGKAVSKIKRKESKSHSAEIKADGMAVSKAKPDIAAGASHTDADNRKDVAEGCEVFWVDYYRVYSVGHMEGDIYVEDIYEEVFLGSGDFIYSAECFETDDPLPTDPCEIFFCYDEGSEGGGGFNQNLPCNTSGAIFTTHAGATPSQSLGSNDWGLTYPESVEITISACNDGVKWNAQVQAVIGHYSIQTRLLPGVTEVTGPGGNTTSSNYCQQMNNLMTLGNSPVTWYMLQAVKDHEAVHESHFFGSLAKIATPLKTAIEALSVPATGQDEPTAIAAIKALSAYATLKANAQPNWYNRILIDVTGDHGTLSPTEQAEWKVVNPMKVGICSYSKTQSGWPACGICP